MLTRVTQWLLRDLPECRSQSSLTFPQVARIHRGFVLDQRVALSAEDKVKVLSGNSARLLKM
jgi:hypothetical protein